MQLFNQMLVRAVSEQFQCSFRAVSEQFQCILRTVSEQFQSSFRAVSEQFCIDDLVANLIDLLEKMRREDERRVWQRCSVPFPQLISMGI